MVAKSSPISEERATAAEAARLNLAGRFAVALLLIIHAGLLLHSLRLHSVTIDESAHVPSGLVHWHTGKFGAYRVNPPLSRMLATLPLLASDCQWVDGMPESYRNPYNRIEWGINKTFFNFNRERYHDWIFRARLAGVAWSCLGGWLIFRWARELYGCRGALLALAIWCFEPNVLAYAQLVTPDMPCTVAGLLTMYVFRHYLRSPHWAGAALSGMALGLALLTKFTLLALIPAMGLLAAVAAQRPVGVSAMRFAMTRIAHAALCFVAAAVFVNGGYLFEGSFRRLDQIPFISRMFSGAELSIDAAPEEAGNRLRGTWIGRLPSPAPEDWLRGIDVQRHDFEEMPNIRPSYLRGEWRERGWWYYYLYALAVKMPLGTIGLCLGGMGLALLGRRSAGWREELVIYLPGFAIVALVSSQTGFNHHVRYVLPALPFLIIGAGKLVQSNPHVPRAAIARIICCLAIVAVAWASISSLRVYPHSLSYFNEAAGGPQNGHAHLVDSNIDWGQDLFFLRNWLDEHPEARPIKTALYAMQPVQENVLGFEPQPPPNGL